MESQCITTIHEILLTPMNRMMERWHDLATGIRRGTAYTLTNKRFPLSTPSDPPPLPLHHRGGFGFGDVHRCLGGVWMNSIWIHAEVCFFNIKSLGSETKCRDPKAPIKTEPVSLDPSWNKASKRGGGGMKNTHPTTPLHGRRKYEK